MAPVAQTGLSFKTNRCRCLTIPNDIVKLAKQSGTTDLGGFHSSKFGNQYISNPTETMTRKPSLRTGTRCFLGILALSCVLLPACNSKSEEEVALIPVTGKVTANGKVLPMGRVEFYPDEAKGNTNKKSPAGQIQADGTYKLVYGTSSGVKDGAPAGWYKVVVHPGTPVTEEQKGLKAEQFNSDFSKVKSTKLLIEVKAGANGDAYDIKLTK